MKTTIYISLLMLLVVSCEKTLHQCEEPKINMHRDYPNRINTPKLDTVIKLKPSRLSRRIF